MTFSSNAHTHSRWCDGADAIPAMVEAARALGFVSLGFSGHAWQGFDPDYSMAPDVQAGYFAELRALQAAPEPAFRACGLGLNWTRWPIRTAAARPVPKRITSSARRTTCAKATAARPWPWTGTRAAASLCG